MSQSSLNGYFERVRRLFKLVGVSDVPAGVTPVVIAGDSREPGTTVLSYRRFALAAPPVASLGAVTPQKFLFGADAVIDRIVYESTGTAGANPIFRIMTVADVAADAGATYNPVTTSQGAYVDRPEAGPPPFDFATNGSTVLGRVWRQLSTAPAARVFDAGLFLRSGEALCFVLPTGSTSIAVSVEGYLRGP